MKSMLVLSFTVCSCSLSAQSSFYDHIPLGAYKVGFCDSLIFCEDEAFAAFDYAGNAPLFLQIWHPIDTLSKPVKLRFKHFRNRTISDELSSVYDPLCQKMDSAFVWYNIQEDFVNYDSMDYGNLTYFEVLDSLKSYQTQSYFSSEIEKTDMPVIVYHHGAQGLSDENFVLAEFFASRGYIVVSSNFHLPYAHSTYGYSEGSGAEALHYAKTVIKFARSLSAANEVYFIGHSMGAQIGFSFLYEPGWASAFVSMETTLEFWDTEKIELTWPALNTLMKAHEKDYSIPILMFANTKENKPFAFYSGITNASTIHASAKEEFGHESYTAGYLMRYFYNEQFAQPDALQMRRQVELYAEHLAFMEEFIESCRTNTRPSLEQFQKDFFILERKPHIPKNTSP